MDEMRQGNPTRPTFLDWLYEDIARAISESTRAPIAKCNRHLDVEHFRRRVDATRGVGTRAQR